MSTTRKSTPDLMGGMPKRPGPGRPPKTLSRTADQIATDLEKEGQKMIHAAKLLRGKIKE